MKKSPNYILELKLIAATPVGALFQDKNGGIRFARIGASLIGRAGEAIIAYAEEGRPISVAMSDCVYSMHVGDTIVLKSEAEMTPPPEVGDQKIDKYPHPSIVRVTPFLADDASFGGIINGKICSVDDREYKKVAGVEVRYYGGSKRLHVSGFGWVECGGSIYETTTLTRAIETGEQPDPEPTTEKKPYRDWLLDIIRTEGHCEDAKAHAWDEFGGLHGLAAWALKHGVLFEVRRGEDEDRIVYTRA